MNPSGRPPLRRSATDRMIAGVCGGIAQTLQVDPTIVRLLAVLLALSSMGTVVLIYVIMAVVMPVDLPSVEAPGAVQAERTLEALAVDGVTPPAAEPPVLPGASLAPGSSTFTAEEIKRWDLPGAAEIIEQEATRGAGPSGPPR